MHSMDECLRSSFIFFLLLGAAIDR
uniref:Uncharacterized protein n=1 Tax=Arundo donax TaxID=35708 RepID=A0A0A9H8J2_ARUDO